MLRGSIHRRWLCFFPIDDQVARNGGGSTEGQNHRPPGQTRARPVSDGVETAKEAKRIYWPQARKVSCIELFDRTPVVVVNVRPFSIIVILAWFGSE